jgi:hypothetical protein
VPFAVELVIPRKVVVLQVVVSILAIIDAIGSTVEIVVVTLGGVIQAEDRRGFSIIGPRRNIVTGRHGQLYDPLLAVRSIAC